MTLPLSAGVKRPAEVVPVADGVYEATYVPVAEGPCTVEVKHANQQVPGRCVFE